MNLISRILYPLCLTIAAAANAEFEQKTAYLAGVSQMIAKHNAPISNDCLIQIQCALGAFNSLKARQIVYVSTPITSGKRLYEYMDAHGYKTMQEARADRKSFFQHVISPNIENSKKATAAISLKIDGAAIAPTDFENGFHCKKELSWGQHEFMSMWLSLIEQKATRIVMLDGWPYSNGSCEEYLLAASMQMGFASRSDIQITDERGDLLNIDQGVELLYEAFTDVHSRGLKPINIAETLAALLEAEQRNADSPRGILPAYDRTKIKTIADDFRAICAKDYPEIFRNYR